MTNPSTISRGNISGEWVLAITISPAAIGATTTSEQTFTVPGLQLGDFADISKPSANPGIGIVNTRVSAANTLAIEFQNLSTGTLTPTASEVYLVNVTRAENLANNFPILTQIT